MDLSTVLTDIQTLLLTNAGSRPVRRESYTPSEMTDNKTEGFYLWEFEPDYIQECSEYMTGTYEGALIIITYAHTRLKRIERNQQMLDVLFPEVHGKRRSVGPTPLTNTYLHYTKLDSVSELFVNKAGHTVTETPGLVLTCRLKISL